MPRRQPRWPSIGFASASSAARRRIVSTSVPSAPRHFLQLRVRVRQELVQRRVEQPDRHRQPGHDAEQLVEVVALERQQPRQRSAAAGLVAAP